MFGRITEYVSVKPQSMSNKLITVCNKNSKTSITLLSDF